MSEWWCRYPLMLVLGLAPAPAVAATVIPVPALVSVPAGLFIAGVEAGYNNGCTGGAQGCQVNIALDNNPPCYGIDMSVPDADTFRIRLILDVNTAIKARLLDPDNEVVARNAYGMDSVRAIGGEAPEELPYEIVAPGI